MSQPKVIVRANYDRLSRWYDLIAGSERALGLAGLALLDLQLGERVLEIGPGPGALLAELAQRVGPSGAVWGVDLSFEMCRVAQRRLARAGYTSWAAATCGDAVHLPCAHAEFDAALLSFTLELFDDAEAAAVLGECRRALRPHGRLALVALAETDRPGHMARLYAWSHRRFPELIDCRPIRGSRLLAGGGWRIETQQCTRLWGLPVELMLATNG